MWRRIWWGGLAGAVAALVMFACALGLAHLGQPDCLRPFLAFAFPTVAREHSGMQPLALATGTVFHEGVAIGMGMLGTRVMASWMRPLAGMIWLAGGGLTMELIDRALLAWRAPSMPLMLGGVQLLPYLAFGVVLATVSLLPICFAVLPAGVAALPPPLPRGAVLERPVLEVLIAPHCFGCERAYLLADEARHRFPALDVRVVDLERVTAPLPARVVAVPAYVLDGRLLFTGNPTAEALLQALTRIVAATDAPGTE